MAFQRQSTSRTGQATVTPPALSHSRLVAAVLSIAAAGAMVLSVTGASAASAGANARDLAAKTGSSPAGLKVGIADPNLITETTLIAAQPGVTASHENAARQGNASVASERSNVKWNREWSDNFTGPAGAGVGQAIWLYDTGQGVFGTGETETMTSLPSNVHLDGHGALDITAIGRGGSWTSGRIETQSNGFAAPDGAEMMVTASIEQPDPAHGAGYWPAFWLLGPGLSPESGEIDILEDVDGLSEASSTFHCGNLTQRNPDGTFGPCHESTGLSSGLQPCTDCQTAYHTYSVIIDRRDESDQQIRWYIDGRQSFGVSESQVGAGFWTEAVDHGFSIIFDLALGGSFPDGICGCTGPQAATSSGATMSIRDVAVYRS